MARPINPNSARQQRLAGKVPPKPKLATDSGRLIVPPGLIESIQANARERRQTRADNPQLNPFQIQHHQLHPPGARPPRDVQMAMDSAIGWAANDWSGGGPLGQVFAEGLAFPGYPYLAELAQRPEYRTAVEIISTEMTRKWIKFSGKGTAHQQRQRDRKMAEDFDLPDPHPEEREDDEKLDSSEKQEKIAQLEEFLDNLHCRDAYRSMDEKDGYFGRGHLFHEIAGNDGSTPEGREELQSDIGIGIGSISRAKVNRNNPLTRLKVVEPVWMYPTTYNAMNPLMDDFYNPTVWYVQGMPIHASRMFTQIGRPVPDLLKPAYSFGGLSLSQIMQPYVNIWLETRESIGRLIHAFSVMVLSTDLQTLMQPGGAALMERVNLFNTLRDNNGCFVLNKQTEDFKNVNVPLGNLHELQAQSQEHLCVSRGTLVETDRGQVPIEQVTTRDWVLTGTGGFAPIKWVGITGRASTLVEIETKYSVLRVTECHPIWSSTEGAFVNAKNVNSSHRLVQSECWENSVHQSLGVVIGGGKQRLDTIETSNLEACSIVKYTKSISVLFQKASTFITEMMTRATIACRTLSCFLMASTCQSTLEMGAMDSLALARTMGRNVFNAGGPIEPCGLEKLCIVQMRASSELINSVEVKSVRHVNVGLEDVYNLSVADGFEPEFYANGILVHNCSVIRAPVAIYTGISPTGLNASSEGEIRIFENTIHAHQEARFRKNLTKTINFAQLSLWDEVDPDIVHEFVQLRELTEKEEAELRKLDAETDDLLMNGCQAISPEEVRIRVAGDNNGPHAGIDPDDLPEPPQPMLPAEGGPEGGSEPGKGGAQGPSGISNAQPGAGRPGEPKPGGRLNVGGHMAYTGVQGGDENSLDEGEGGEGSAPPGGVAQYGGNFSSLAEPQQNPELHPGYATGPFMGANPIARKKRNLAHDAEFNEADHPRAPDGKFGSGGGSGERVKFVSAGAKKGESSQPAKPSSPRQKSITELTPEERAEWKKRAAEEMAAAEAKHGKKHKTLAEAASGEGTTERVEFKSLGATKQAEAPMNEKQSALKAAYQQSYAEGANAFMKDDPEYDNPYDALKNPGDAIRKRAWDLGFEAAMVKLASG